MQRSRSGTKILENTRVRIFWIFVKQHIQKSHIKTRTGQGGSIDYACDRGNCGKRFRFAGNLKDHLRLHDNDVYRCHFCPWTGVMQHNYLSHLNTHFQIKPYLCTFCDLRFYTISHRTRHESIFHEKIKPVLGCGSCDFKTLNEHQYRKHIKACEKRKIRRI